MEDNLKKPDESSQQCHLVDYSDSDDTDEADNVENVEKRSPNIVNYSDTDNADVSGQFSYIIKSLLTLILLLVVLF